MSARLLLAIAAVLATAAPLSAQGTRLLRHPAVSKDLVAFEYAGDLWVVGRNGGSARRLTATPGVETDPQFSPDGSLIAYSGTSGGNTDVYVIPAAGGDPKRLTYHPGVDRARGWTADSKHVLFASERTSAPQQSYYRLWSISIDGGLPEVLPMPRAYSGTYSPDGKRFAYEEIGTQFIPEWYEASEWRHYRGGRTHPIWIISLADYSVEKLPRANSNDSDPMWIGNTVYFVSDRNYTANLFAYNLDSKKTEQLTHHDDYDIQNASAGPDAIVYEQAGYVHLFDVKTGQSRKLEIDVKGDLPWARPQMKHVASMIRSASLSPTGVRAAFEARGDVFTVPATQGDYRNLTRTTGAHEHSPVWSPDGSQVAWLSDASGEYQLMIGDQLGLAKPRVVTLPGNGYYSSPTWSPDGKHLLLEDNHLTLWTLDVASGRATKIDSDTYFDPTRDIDMAWSPDSRWVAYSRNIDSHMRAVFLYSLEEGKPHQITDGMSDVVSPAFDAGGKYLYFLASTDYGPRTSWLEMSSLDRPARRSIYLAVLSASEPSPLLPEAGDEPIAAAAAVVALASKPRADTTASQVRIDLDGIAQRILPIGVPAGDYSDLSAATAGSFLYMDAMPNAGGAARLERYQIKERSATPILEGIRSYTLSGDRKKLLYQAARGAPESRWGIVAADKPAKVGEGAINVGQLEMLVDPRAEWPEIFKETWRTQRDYFYDAKMHGANWQAVYDKYAPFLPFVGHRSDLGYIIALTGGELTVGHSYLSGPGDEPEEQPESVGLLGADFAIENGRYRITHIYSGENWNPDLRAPLSAPGIRVAEGDYILEVNGRPLTPPTNLYSVFLGTAGHQTEIRVGKSPTGDDSRVVTVVPVASEEGLRTRAWVEANRRKVDQLSGGRLAYVWLPNTAGGGYTSFTRYFYAQQEKEGAVIDERYNHGGMVADYIVNELERKPMGYFATREGKVSTTPIAGIYGPKVMLINESAGSGGDALPYMFHQRQIGPLIGTRTWGGLVGTLGVPQTIDGGGITAPGLAFYDLQGKWAIENEGVPPDVDVEYTPADVIKGHDPQLERAVQEALTILKTKPALRVARPAPIDRTSRKNP
ncbi:MAG TPA: PDZ domain-containing protein [Gemmatimonadaceae bacterium]|jgi:tricorn protease